MAKNQSTDSTSTKGGGTGSVAPNPLVVTTDQLDYAPGSTVTITATGVTTGGTVTFYLADDPNDPGIDGEADNYGSFTVKDGGAGDLDGVVNGSITTTWTVPEYDAIDGTIILTATDYGGKGSKDDRTATTTFTDSINSGDVDLEQWSNGPAPDADGTGNDNEEWVNGNLGASKAHYVEGEAIPYRATLDDLETGSTYTLKIEWDTLQGTAYAIDYLVSYDFSFDTEHPLEPDPNPLLGITDISSGDVTQVAIQSDPQLLIGFNTGATTDGLGSGTPSGTQYFTVFGDVTNLSTGAIVYNADFSKASTTITFTYTGLETNTADSVVIVWGGHIASSAEWNDDPGENVDTASDISGSPYHMRLIDIVQDGDTISLGNMDRSLSAEAVEAPKGSITIIKDAVPNDGQDFSYTTTGTDLSDFSLDDDADGTLSNTQVFSNLAAGTYTLAELTQLGWDLTNIVITGDDGDSLIGGDGDFDAGDTTATITLDPGENITVTYTNTKLGKITVDKVTDPSGDPALFSFDASWLVDTSDFSLADSTTPFTSAFLAAGTYMVTEADLAGWDLTNLVINDPDGGSSVDLVNGIATIDLDAGENITVTYTNTKLGSITVVKDAVPNDGQDFSYTTTGTDLSDFSLDDDADGTLSNTQVFSNLAAGTYTLAELTQLGWDLTNIVITGDDGDSLIGGDGDFDAGDTTATITLDPGENITVTYTNTKRGSIEGIKFDDLNGDGDRDAPNEPGLDNVTIQLLAADGETVLQTVATELDGSFSFGNLVPGTYYVQEVVPGDTEATTETKVMVEVEAGETMDLGYVFGNFELFDISGYKWNDADHDSVWDDNELGLGGWTIQLDKDADGNIDDTYVTEADGYYEFTDLGPGTYKVTEVNQTGWVPTFGENGYVIIGVSGQDVSGDFGDAEDPNFGNFFPDPSLDFDKLVFSVKNGDGSVDSDGAVDTAGDVITYCLAVENTGNVALTDVDVSDQFENNDLVTWNWNGSSWVINDPDAIVGEYTVNEIDADLNVLTNDGILEEGEILKITYTHVVTDDDLADARQIVTETVQIGYLTCTIKFCAGDLDLDNTSFVAATADPQFVTGDPLTDYDYEVVDVTCPVDCTETTTDPYGGSLAENLWRTHQEEALA